MAVNGIGDVVAIVQITIQVAQTLEGVKNAPKEVKRLIEEVKRYQSCIASAVTSIRKHGAILKPHDSIKRDIFWFLRQCAETTDKLSKIANSYQDIVSKDGGAASNDEASWNQWIKALKTVYHRIKWTTKGDIVEDLRAEISRHVQILTSLNQHLML